MSARPGRRNVLRWSVAAALVLVPAACGGDDDDDGNGDAAAVQPFAEVQVDDFRFEVDATNPERAIFHVTTTEPMICAIVWGPTEAFGNFNNSLAMSGTGITEHDVFLPGVEPGATYFFRVQGSTADGTLYQSETATFTIPATEADAAPADEGSPRVNLALAATVADVSSEFSDGFAAANAIDDSGTTEWSSAGDGDDAFIVLDLGAPSEIAGVEFITRSMADGSAVAETFSVSVDGEAFGPFPAGTPVDPATAAVSATGQLVRFDVESSTGGNTGAVELRILAP